MPIACLIIARPLDRATGTRVPIYMSSANDRRVTGLNNVLWEPAIKAPPPLTINLWNGDFQAAPDPGNATFTVNMGVVKRSFPAADSYAWMGAPVEIYAAEIGTAWPWTQRVLGRVSSYNRRGQSLTLTAKVETEKFAKNVLTATYAGSGGVEGGADLKNRVKPLVIGWAKNVEPVLIDAVNSVYQVSGYGAIEGVTTLYERASDFGASIGDFGTYAALVAASIPAGRWATCLAAGLVRLGAPAYGVITADVRGHKVGSTTPRLTGAVISTLATIAGVSGSDLHSASLAALDSAVPYPINLVLTDQTTFIDIAQRLALGCNWQSAISLVGTFFVSAINLASSPAVTLNAQGRASPQVINLPDELEVSVPYWKVTMGANRSWRVQTPDEIATAAALVERGTYSGAETYREGNIVELGDGSRYQYIAMTPAAGISPPNATYWTMLSASPVVAGIVGQSPWATYADYTPAQVTTPGANLIFNSSFNIGSTGWVIDGWLGPSKAAGDVGAYYVATPNNGTYLYTADVTKTPIFASLPYTVQVWGAANGTSSDGSRPFIYIDWHRADGSLSRSSPPAYIPVGEGYKTVWVADTAPADAVYARVVCCSNGVGAGGGWVYVSKWKLELGNAPTPWSDEATNGALYQSGQTIDSLKPAQVGADVTGANTAAAIAGQAWAATNGAQATVDNGYVSGFANQAIDSEFTLGNRSWDEGWASSGTWVWDYFTALTSKRFLARYCVSPAAGAQISMGQNTFCGLPVIDGDRLELSAIVSWSNMSVANLFVGFFSAAGAYIGGQVIASGIMDTRVGGFVTVPAGYGIGIAKLMATFTVATGGTIANGRIAQPFIRRCSTGQTALSPYQPGTPIERGADVTGSNTAAAIAGQAATATNSDYGAVTGAKPPSDADKTGTNIAAGISGQAATATNSDYGAVTGAKPPSDADKTGTNIAAGISGQAATATNSDYGAVTGTKPPSNATNGAPSGTPVGSISANDVAATINPGGGVATNKVSTPAMVLNAVNMPYASTLGYSVTLPRYVETNIFPSSLAPTASTDDTMIRVTVLLSLACDNDIQGYYRVYHTPPGGTETLIYDKFLQIYSDAFAPSSQTLSFVHRITSPAAGTHSFRVAFYRTSDASIFYADAGSDQEAIVIRR